MILKGLLFCALLTVFASCQTYPDLNLPIAEECWNSVEQTGKLLCRDERLSPADRVYVRFLGQGRNGERQEDVTTNSSDFKVVRDELIETKRKYLVCKKYPKKCQ